MRLLLCSFVCLLCSFAEAAGKTIVVDKDGAGDFRSIQDAVNSLPVAADAPRIIFVRKGVYREKVFIDKDFVSLIGEDRNKTIITISLARDVWRCEHPDDWGVAAINLKGSDIVLENLTITNSFGFDNMNNKEGIRFDCPNDTLNPSKVTGRDGHQMALRSFTTTRLIVRNCTLRAYGGDTVSPWNTDNGMFYFSNCLMEGGVDFYCPRGWAYAENCEFVAHGNVAAIWHDGSRYKDSKTVLVNCKFRGDDGFKLARYHRDAQFYLVNCSFANNMADAAVYLNPSNPQNTIQWGHRVYFYNSHREGGDYAWHRDNLETAEGSPKASQINTAWTFAGKWQPTSIPTKVVIDEEQKRQTPVAALKTQQTTDPVAENMLAYQRAAGGWPKAVNEIKVDYNKVLSDAERTAIKNDSMHKDATIDNAATMREIRYLAKAFKKTRNPDYLRAAEKGIRYYLRAQYANGGWPQYYPDSALYRSQITYNDDAMVNVLNVLQDVLESKNDLDVIDRAYVPAIADAVNRGVQCILKTQIVVDGKRTAWCAQYNKKTLQPEMARKFELASLSGSESVGITRFLMRVKDPSEEIKNAVKAAVEWFEKVKITGYKYGDVNAPNEPKGKDRVITPEPGSVIWARFYEIGTNRPFFTGRDSVKKYDVREIESERRNGYAWYGTWPEKLLKTEYPAWKREHGI
ncbi:pectate lyase [Sediminibacterium roseum]|uniref:Pectate lyase n=1 Tax=Sediminibacterium roseum TaxID=1978412 RepID=A0ABX0A2H4_9BACT|nr:pectate lyase [Sediminibacterium roseum]NCI51623.1 pectate lyase [Sediminibacterium roseum]